MLHGHAVIVRAVAFEVIYAELFAEPFVHVEGNGVRVFELRRIKSVRVPDLDAIAEHRPACESVLLRYNLSVRRRVIQSGQFFARGHRKAQIQYRTRCERGGNFIIRRNVLIPFFHIS